MPKRILRDPLQAKLRQMEKKQKSTTQKGSIKESPKFNKPFENIERVKQKPKVVEDISEITKNNPNIKFKLEQSRLEKIAYYKKIDLNASLSMLRDLASLGTLIIFQ